MESKVCTYTEKNVRLQLVRVVDRGNSLLEIRFNRKVLGTYHIDLAFEAKLYFSHCVHKILLDRTLSDLTSV